MVHTNIVVMQFFCDSAVSVSFFVLVEDYNNLFLYHLVFGRILRLVQIVVERAARKSGKLQQCLQGIFLPQFLNYFMSSGTAVGATIAVVLQLCLPRKKKAVKVALEG